MIGNTIRKMREASGYSQLELAKTIGVTQNTISRYEINEIKPKFETVERIAKACDFKIKFIDKNSGEEITVKENWKKS